MLDRKPIISLLAALLALVAVQSARADVLVLVHGYLGDGLSWQRSGAQQPLQKAGWVWGGTLPNAISPQAASQDTFYTANLPSKAPLSIQADILTRQLAVVSKRHPDEPITLVGHSAGGVVARLALVRHGAGQVTRLITIASPHLGTPRAIQALQATDDGGMFGFMKRWLVKREVGDQMYRTVRQSRGALIDLTPPSPGNMLGWLNNQPHPDIEYISIIRGGPTPMAVDTIVPAISQDLRQVPALRGKATSYTLPSKHLLSPLDGRAILGLLAQASKKKSG